MPKDLAAFSANLNTVAAQLAEQILGWKHGQGRFVQPGGGWCPDWRFQPFTKFEDAFRLLEKSASAYSLSLASDGIFTAQVRVGSRTSRASGTSRAATITVAVARATGLDVPNHLLEHQKP